MTSGFAAQLSDRYDSDVTKAEQVGRLQELLRQGEETIQEAPQPAGGRFSPDHRWVKPEQGAAFRTAGLHLLGELFGPTHQHYREFDVSTKDQNVVSSYRKAIGVLAAVLVEAKRSPETGVAAPREPAEPQRRAAFLVHGHAAGVKESVARFLAQLDIAPIILHEQPNGGKTVIEKLEHHSDVPFAVVLLTPDDRGAAKDEVTALRERARQNVVLELGYFIGKLGRSRVCALHQGAIELPSDIVGVVWIRFDEGGAWQMQLARELKHAGFSIDFNAAL